MLNAFTPLSTPFSQPQLRFGNHQKLEAIRKLLDSTPTDQLILKSSYQRSDEIDLDWDETVFDVSVERRQEPMPITWLDILCLVMEIGLANDNEQVMMRELGHTLNPDIEDDPEFAEMLDGILEKQNDLDLLAEGEIEDVDGDTVVTYELTEKAQEIIGKAPDASRAEAGCKYELLSTQLMEHGIVKDLRSGFFNKPVFKVGSYDAKDIAFSHMDLLKAIRDFIQETLERHPESQEDEASLLDLESYLVQSPELVGYLDKALEKMSPYVDLDRQALSIKLLPKGALAIKLYDEYPF